MDKPIFKAASAAELANRPQEQHFDPRVMEFAKQFPDGKISSGNVQEWFSRNRGIPRRTFYWYQSEELIPSPVLREGRNSFFL